MTNKSSKREKDDIISVESKTLTKQQNPESMKK